MSTHQIMKNGVPSKGGLLRSVFMCGFIDGRWHNSSLYSIVADLMSTYYVCCNASSAAQWSMAKTKEMLANAGVFLFFVNEFTLGDVRCLLTLQYAWDYMVPIFMLRPPRTKLVVCETEPGYKTPASDINNGVITRSATQSSSHLTKNEPSPPLSDYQPDYPLLQYILYQGYKMSIPYDRLNHCRSMNKIKGRLQKVLQPFAHLDPSRSPACGTLSYSDESARTISSTVPSSASIKSTRSQQNATPTSHSANASEGLRLSRSMNNITAAVNQKRNHSNTTKGNSTSGSRKHRLKQKIPTPHQLSTESNHGTTGRLVRYGSQESNNSRSSIGRRSSLSDASNFHATQYLVFPVKDKSQEPILIHFPQDVIENDDNRLKGTWGSDTSLEEDAEIAPKIRGDLQLTSEDDDDGLRADGMHAPYNDHL